MDSVKHLSVNDWSSYVSITDNCKNITSATIYNENGYLSRDVRFDGIDKTLKMRCADADVSPWLESLNVNIFDLRHNNRITYKFGNISVSNVDSYEVSRANASKMRRAVYDLMDAMHDDKIKSNEYNYQQFTASMQ